MKQTNTQIDAYENTTFLVEVIMTLQRRLRDGLRQTVSLQSC